MHQKKRKGGKKVHQRKRKGGEKVHQKIISGREVHEKNNKWKRSARKK